MNKPLLAFGLVAVLSTPALAKKRPPPPGPITVHFGDATGKDLGTATLTEKNDSVSIALDLHDLTPGEHAIHVHEKAICQTPDFKSAGGHFNPDSKQHGMDNKMGPHAGDMPNFKVDAKGKAKTTVVAKNVTLSDGAHSLLANGGTALVIHAKADDMKTDPSGNSGDRIACGVVTTAVLGK